MRYHNLALTINGAEVGTAPPPGDATAYAPVVIEWGSDNGLDQPHPARLEITISCKPGAWPTLGDVVSLTGETESHPARLPMFDGVIHRIERIPDLGKDWLRIECDDWRAVANRRYIGAEPWPIQSVGARCAEILAAAPEIPYNMNRLLEMPATTLVAPRDVDNQSVGQLLAETLSGIDWITTSTPNGLDFMPRPISGTQTLVVQPGLGDAYLTLDEYSDTNPIVCHAGAVLDAPRELTLDNLLNHVALEFPLEPSPDEEHTGNWPDQAEVWEYPESITRYGEAAYSTRTDVLDPWRRSNALRTAAALTPAWCLSRYLIDPRSKHWPVGNFTTRIGSELTREFTTIVFTHTADETITAGRIINGTLTLGATRLESLELTLEPATISSGLGLRFDQFRRFSNQTTRFNNPFLTTFDQTAGTFADFTIELMPDVRFNDLKGLNFDDLATANTVTWKGLTKL